MNLRIRNGVYCSRQIIKEISTKYEDFSDNIPINEFYLQHKKILNELIRVSPMVFYNVQFVTGSKRAFFKLIGDFSEQLKEIIVWDKINAQPAMGVGVLNSQYEVIMVFDKFHSIARKFYDATFRGTISNVWKIKRAKPKKGNGATFPEELVENILVNLVSKGGTIYDPFAGTGTTLIIAKKMGFNFLGSEISKKQCEQIEANLPERTIR
jgi:site-specific DNA-methyltransferase (adenine-specific)/modification methylase